MNIDYATVWDGLPRPLQEKLLDDPGGVSLDDDEVSALVHSGVGVATSYWVSSGPDGRWDVSGAFRQWIVEHQKVTDR